jgi:glycosyltransferase involved in cell wall biosynthesis
MFVSVIICTYGRPTTLSALLDCLLRQSYREIEILVVDGNESQVPSRAAVGTLVSELRDRGPIRIINSRRGLTRQRNAGMRESRGDLVVFLDDDVTFDERFIAQTVELFKRPDMTKVGGITGYDELTYGGPLAPRWRIRRFFGAIPSLQPGEIDRLGRAVPVNFVKPFSGFMQVGWLAGFCMIYRRAAVDGLEFDECLPTYGGEDRDFSVQVGRHWTLLLCGDLRLKHHGSPENRDSEVYRMLQNSFGAGRRFGKAARGFSDYCVILRTLLGDLIVDLLSLLSHPSRNRFLIPFARISGLIHGIRSVHGGVAMSWDSDSSGRNRVVANG